MKAKTKNKGYIFLILSLFLISVLIFAGVYAYFTARYIMGDNVSFGIIELDTTSDNKTSMTFTINGITNAKALPGDTVLININVKLRDDSEDAYYLIFPKSNSNVLSLPNDCDAFFEANNKLYATDGEKVYEINQTTWAFTEITNPSVFAGSISSSAVHSIQIPVLIDASLTQDQVSGDETIECSVCAIQQANLSMSASIYTLLNGLN